MKLLQYWQYPAVWCSFINIF